MRELSLGGKVRRLPGILEQRLLDTQSRCSTRSPAVRHVRQVQGSNLGASVPDPDHMFLGLPDPDLLVRSMDPDPALDPDPDPSIIMQK
jgi:hypothetical protein